jgi:mannosyltransferase
MALLEARTASPSRAFAASPGTPRVRLVATALGVLAAILAAIGSWIPSLWGDEAASVLSAERSLPSLFRMLGHVDAVHGTYYFLLHFWVGAFGASPFSVRLPSAFAVGLTVAGVVILTTRLAGARAGILAGVVCVILPRVTYMGAEARGYALSAACVTWLTIVLVVALSSARPRRRLWVLYSVGLAVCGYVFLFSLLIVVAHAGVVLTHRRRFVRRAWWKAVAGGLALALPVIVYGFAERDQVAFLVDRTATTFISTTVSPWFGNSDFAILAWVLILIAVGLAVRQWLRARRLVGLQFTQSKGEATPPSLVLLATLWLVAPAVILLTVNAVHAIYSSRYLSFATPAAALLIGWLLAKARPRWIVMPLVLALVAAAVPTYLAQRTPYAQNGSDWAADATVIQTRAKPGDAVLFDEATRPSRNPRLAMRTYPAAFAGLTDVALKSPWWANDGWRDTTYPLLTVASRLDNSPAVWLIEYRSPGGTASRYDLSTLAALGFRVEHRYGEHSSVVIELVRA